MAESKRLSRRKFLKVGAIASGGFLISLSLPSMIESVKGAQAGPLYSSFNPFLQIGCDSSVKVFLSKVEMGQGMWTTLPMLIAEELGCHWDKIIVEPLTFQSDKDFSDDIFRLSTGGSDSTKSEFDHYRTAGATARAMLVAVAAKRMGVRPESCRVADGIISSGEDEIAFGDVAAEAAMVSVPEVKLKDSKEWKLIGKATKRLDAGVKVNGTARYGIDLTFPGVPTAVVARCPVFGGSVGKFNADRARAVPGVQDVVQIEEGIAVVADNFWSAKMGRDALEITWSLPDKPASSEEIKKDYAALATRKGTVVQEKGDVYSSLSSASNRHVLEYTFPYLAHSPMEPLNCTVIVNESRWEVWAGTQSNALHHDEIARYLGIPRSKITFKTPFLGGSFGRRGTLGKDWVIEAVHIARATGKSVKCVWTREDDTTGGMYRPIYHHRVEVALNEQKIPEAWLHRIVGQSLFAGTLLEKYIVNNGIDYSTTDGVNQSAYFRSMPNVSLELHTTISPVTVLPWRSVGNTHTAFAMECTLDQLAYRAGIDPVVYRKQLLGNDSRHVAALDLAATKANWNDPLPADRFRGIAVHAAMGSFVCQVAEISITNNSIRVHRVVCAIDCGLAVNPEGVIAQMESGIIYGLSAALYGDIDISDGQATQKNFHEYRMLRISECPDIEVYIVPGEQKMGGAGEPGVPPIAAAVANAVFAATGKRPMSLPIKLDAPV